MELNINQEKFALGNKYKLYLGSELKYSASTKLFKFLPEIDVVEVSSQNHVLNIKRKWEWFKYTFEITNSKNQVFEFTTQSLWKRHYQCIVGANKYDIYGHKGRKFSIYKNDIMIGYWELARVTWFEGDNYNIVVDNNTDIELISAFCLCVDSINSKSKQGAFSLNIGWFGPQVREFDSTWYVK